METVKELAKRFATGMMDAYELEVLGNLIVETSWNPGEFLVEIGAYHGMTTSFMATLLKRIFPHPGIISVDAFDRLQDVDPTGSYETYREVTRRNNMDDICFPLGAFSYQVAGFIQPNAKFLVVDGGHDYGTTITDLVLYCPKVLPGGVVFCDDYQPQYPGVVKAVDEYFKRGEENSEWVEFHADIPAGNKYFIAFRRRE